MAGAAFCQIAGGVDPADPTLRCWRPRDGAVATVRHHAGGPRVDADGSPGLRGRRPPGHRPLATGATFRWRCRYVRTPFAEICGGGGPVVFTCASRPRALVCRNRGGEGFALGRRRGASLLSSGR